jgi:hypothetical protein
MLTVPLGSLVTILGLVGFALLTDGISVRARVRSLTHIDQRTQHAVSYSRQSYYAGVAPASGLAFPDDVVVLPIDHSPVSSQSRIARKRRVIEHRGETMHFKVGYLPSRTTVQYMVTSSQKTELRVEIEQDAGNTLAATNELGATIEAIFYRHDGGRLFAGEQVLPRATVHLQEISEEDADKQLSEIMRRDKLEPPLGLDRSLLRDGILVDSWDVYGQHRKRHGNRTNPMERTFLSIRNDGASAILAGSYLAIVESCAEVPLGVDDCEIREAFHVVIGQF